jgi:6-phospho-3-hexuloisomerase
MNSAEISSLIVQELGRTLGAISPEDGEALVDAILASRKVFVAGAGRSGFMVRAFAMRLMHLGFDSFVVGETVTPNLEKGDLLVIGSGSGETGSLVSMAGKAKKLEAGLALVTIFSKSSIARLADLVVRIPAPTAKSEVETGFASMQPMGSLFEQSLLLFLDSVIVRLMERRGKDSRTMFMRHANLE